MKDKIFLIAVFVSAMILGGMAHAETVSLTLEPDVYSIRKDSDGYDQVKLDGYRTDGSPGTPLLPARVFNLLVPHDIVWESLELEIVNSVSEVLPGRYDIRAGTPDAASRDGVLILDWGKKARAIKEGRNRNIYERDAFFPVESVEILPYSQLRKWKFARVKFHPFQYNPITGELKLSKRIRIELHFQRAAIANAQISAADTAMDRLAPVLFQNYASGRQAYTASKNDILASAAQGYAIITTNAIASGSANLSAFIAHKEARGHSVVLVTETDFESLTGQAPNHRAEKIRQWLINNYLSYGIEHVLLIGDPTPYEEGEEDIPMKMCWPRRGSGSYEETPTDAFYADLTGNWDRDGNGYYGEWSDYVSSGGVDFSMEVWVGRIPVYHADYTTLDNILQKIMDYENAGSTEWRKNVLLPMSFSTTTYDGAPMAEQMKNDYLDSRGYNSWTQYQQGGGACSLNSAYPSDEELRGGTAVRDRWAATPYGIVCWWGHGSVTSTSVGADGCWDGTLFSILQTSSLDDDYPAFTFQTSCTNGTPENSHNLQYSLLKQGAVASVSSTRVSWFNTGVGYGQFAGSSTNSGIGYEYVDRLTHAQSAGQALYEAKLAVVPNIGIRSSRLMNQYDFNLYGDPSLKIGGCEQNEDCDDGLWCNGTEACVDSHCEAGVPVDCDDGNACTDDICDEHLNRCDSACNAAGPVASCCGDSACEQEAICNETCIDQDGDGYGSPASINCTYIDLDCDDTNADVNPGMDEVQGNDIDEDCRPDTPAWGTPSSVLGDEYSRPSDVANYFAMLLVPAAVLLIRKRFFGRK